MKPGAAVVLAIVVIPSLGVLAGSCTRHADIVDEPDGAAIPTVTSTQDAELPAIDASFESDAFADCADRPNSPECTGPVDFPCDFVNWARTAAKNCQTQTGCVTNGSVAVKLDAGGCVTGIAMDQPNDAVVACLVTALSGKKCPCPAMQTTYFFGAGNTGPCP